MLPKYCLIDYSSKEFTVCTESIRAEVPACPYPRGDGVAIKHTLLLQNATELYEVERPALGVTPSRQRGGLNPPCLVDAKGL